MVSVYQRFRRRALVWVALLDLVLLAAFFKLASEVQEHELAALDARITGWVLRPQGPGVLGAMRFFTWLGSTGPTAAVTALAAGLVGWLEGRVWEPLALAVDVAGAAALDAVLKGVYRRARPPGPWLAPAEGYSFPSGHSMVAFALYLFLGHLLWRHLPRRRWRAAAAAGLAAIALAIGLSRIYLGVHYPTDVLAGFAAGGGWALACTLALEAVRPARG